MTNAKHVRSRSGAPAAGDSGFVRLAAAFAALGGLLFGYDTGVISGALIFIRKDFALSTFHQEWVVSVVLVGAAAGALGGGKLADRIGRRATLLWTAAIFVLGAALCAAAPSVPLLLAGRGVIGLAIGLATAAVPLYIAEVSPPSARGWQVSLFQLAITVGILAAYVVDYVFAAGGGWRWMLGLAAVPGALLGLSMLFLPETPRWLAKHGQADAARAVLRRVRGAADVSFEYGEIQNSLLLARERGRWADLGSPAVRPALVVGIGLAIFQQVTGINTVIYYAPTIILSAGISSAAGAILATAGIGLVNVLMTVFAMWLIDRVGRRPLLLAGTAGMIVSLGVLGAVFRVPGHGADLARLAVWTLMAYVASFAISLGPIFWLLIAEIYPLNVRGLAEGVAAGANWTANFAVSLTFLTLVERLGPSWTFWTYGLLAAASLGFSYWLVPETKGRSLEQIEASWRIGRGRAVSGGKS
ncbi:MAG TPA: sugar porter family MFS transporter [Candidatus Acidoferrales bacterium]|nr:sugar porter family MFS transporter [Candidatus Acidoferrales bacterium]